jgi:hypothetical protein
MPGSVVETSKTRPDTGSTTRAASTIPSLCLFNDDFILVGQRVRDAGVERSGMSFFSIRTYARERHTDAVRVLERLPST